MTRTGRPGLLRLLLLATLAVIVLVVPASAQWRTFMADDPDGNGQPVLMHGEEPNGPFIQFWCRGEQRRVSLVLWDGLDGEPAVPEDGYSIEFANDVSGIWASDADLYRHHPGWQGISYRDIDQMQDLAEIVIGAQSEIRVTVINNGDGGLSTYRFNAINSTAAGREFAAKCFDGLSIVAEPSQLPAPEAPEQEAPKQLTPQEQEIADIDEQIRLLDEQIAQSDDILQQADEGLAQADETLGQVDQLLADTAPGRLPWKTGTSGEPPLFFAHGPAIAGDAVLLFGCEIGNGPLLISFNGKAGVSSPQGAVGDILFLFAQTDFETHVLQAQVTQADGTNVTVVGTGEVAAAVLNDLVRGTGTLKMTISTPDGSQAAERDVGLVDVGPAAAEVWEQCMI